MRLLPVLLEAGHTVHCVVRDPSRFSIAPSEQVKVHQADLLEPLEGKLPKKIDAAYYLVHSMSGSTGNFHDKEAQTAQNFLDYIENTEAQQVIYLGGITNSDELSEHLESRQNVEKILKSGKKPLTALKAGIIVGSGSASFEIIRDLVEKLPVMVTPRWLKTRCQPIAIRNVIQYLHGVLLNEETFDEDFDIGGPDILTYKEMLLQFARVRNLRRYIITLPVLTPRLSSYWLFFVTATSYNLARNLVDSMKVEVICKDNRIRDIVDIPLISYAEAVRLAFQKIEQNLVTSSWKDSVVASGHDAQLEKFIEVPKHGCFKDKQLVKIDRPVEEVIDNIWHIGGDRGWYYGTVLWKIRGYMDQIVGGTGLRRGRRSPSEINPGDALDFWRVIVANKQEGRLLLFAEMKLPGEAWLEFRIRKMPNGDYYLKQEATFRPVGLWGRLYWYLSYPFHLFIFSGMANRLNRYSPRKPKAELV